MPTVNPFLQCPDARPITYRRRFERRVAEYLLGQDHLHSAPEGLLLRVVLHDTQNRLTIDAISPSKGVRLYPRDSAVSLEGHGVRTRRSPQLLRRADNRALACAYFYVRHQTAEPRMVLIALDRIVLTKAPLNILYSASLPLEPATVAYLCDDSFEAKST